MRSKKFYITCSASFFILAGVIMTISCNSRSKKDPNSVSQTYLYKLKTGDEMLQVYHGNRDCPAIKAITRKAYVDVSVERYKVEEVEHNPRLCPCVTDATYRKIESRVPVKVDD